jgi:hypothetical protein
MAGFIISSTKKRSPAPCNQPRSVDILSASQSAGMPRRLRLARNDRSLERKPRVYLIIEFRRRATPTGIPDGKVPALRDATPSTAFFRDFRLR